MTKMTYDEFQKSCAEDCHMTEEDEKILQEYIDNDCPTNFTPIRILKKQLRADKRKNKIMAIFSQQIKISNI